MACVMRGYLSCACREREGELSEDDVAIVRVLRCQVAQDDRIEQADDVRHDDLDDRRGIETRGERAALDSSPHRIDERFPVLLRQRGRVFLQLGVMGGGGPELHQQPPGDDARGKASIDHRDQLLPGVVELRHELVHVSDGERSGPPHRLDQHVLARTEIALQGADRHPRRLGHVDEPSAGVAAVGKHRDHLVEHERAPGAARTPSSTRPWIAHAVPYQDTVQTYGYASVLVEDGARTSLDTMSVDELLTFLAGATDIEERGKTEIDGVPVTHFAGTVNLKAALEKAGEDLADHADLLKQSAVILIDG